MPVRGFLAAGLDCLAVDNGVGLGAQSARATAGGPGCMINPVRDSSVTEPISIIVPADRQACLEQRGSTVRAYEGRELKLPQYRSEMCRLGSAAPSAAQKDFVQVVGISASELCTMARALP